MDRNYITGMILLFALFVVWYYINAPSAEELQKQQMVQDSLRLAQSSEEDASIIAAIDGEYQVVGDSSGRLDTNTTMHNGPEQTYTLENALMRINFTSRGGRINEILLKEYDVLTVDEHGDQLKYPVRLLNHESNQFYYSIPQMGGATLRTSDLHFALTKNDDSLIELTASTPSGGKIIQRYSFSDTEYLLNYDVRFEQMTNQVGQRSEQIALHWENHLNHLERNVSFEKMYSTVYFKELDEDTEHCSCTRDDDEVLNKRLKWVGHSNQFFSTNLIANNSFESGRFITKTTELDDPVLKTLVSDVEIKINDFSGETVQMQLYAGPNDFGRLRKIGMGLSDIVPFGVSIFGAINRWIIRPLFLFLSSIIGNMGIVILILTLIVKAALFPLTYRMLYSQAKMAALKPMTADIREKYKDDMQKQQMESMKIYREYGVNPVGGCLPMLLQMPIWFALYRFFPASIEFRQASFLWAPDLSTFDAFVQLPFSLPMMGSHLSLFTLLWVVSLLFYTWWNMKNNMDMSATMNPMMKNMQYIMPVMFFVFLNNYASGLTCYLLFSNLINIGQNIGTKNYLIDEEAIKEQLNVNKAKPKKKTGFQARLEEAMKEQQRMAEERAKKKK